MYACCISMLSLTRMFHYLNIRCEGIRPVSVCTCWQHFVDSVCICVFRSYVCMCICVCVFTSVAMSEQCILDVIFMSGYLWMMSADCGGAFTSFRHRGRSNKSVCVCACVRVCVSVWVCVCVCVRVGGSDTETLQHYSAWFRLQTLRQGSKRYSHLKENCVCVCVCVFAINTALESHRHFRPSNLQTKQYTAKICRFSCYQRRNLNTKLHWLLCSFSFKCDVL